MKSSTQDPQSASAYVPRHLAEPDAVLAGADTPVDPRSSRWDRSVSTLTRLLDELTVLDDGELVAVR
jgi:hypothetical protein